MNYDIIAVVMGIILSIILSIMGKFLSTAQKHIIGKILSIIGRGVVVYTHSQSDPRQLPNNHQPISLTCAFVKLLESIGFLSHC